MAAALAAAQKPFSVAAATKIEAAFQIFIACGLISVADRTELRGSGRRPVAPGLLLDLRGARA
jgi:hypothetical protein